MRISRTTRTCPALCSTEHILLGILKDGGGLAITVLQRAGLVVEQIRLEVERHLPQHANSLSVGEIPFTPKAKKVLEYAVEESRLMGHNYIGTEHLLLGLLKEKEGIPAKVLNSLGVRLVETREEILNLVQEPTTKTSGDIDAEFIAHDLAADPDLQNAYRDLKIALNSSSQVRKIVLNVLKAIAQEHEPS